MVKKTQKKMYESDSDSDSETESKKIIMKLIKKHSKKHGTGLFDDIGNYVTDKKGLASDVLQYGLPTAMGAVGSVGGPAGSIAGKEAGNLLAKKIAEDNDMSRRSQDPFDSGFLQQRDARQSNNTSIQNKENKNKLPIQSNVSLIRLCMMSTKDSLNFYHKICFSIQDLHPS